MNNQVTIKLTDGRTITGELLIEHKDGIEVITREENGITCQWWVPTNLIVEIER